MTAEPPHPSVPGIDAHRLASALHAGPGAVLTTDVRGVVEYANPACCRLLGRPESELLGRPLHEALTIAEDARERPTLAAAIRSPADWREDLTVTRPDEQVVHVRVVLSSFRSLRGELAGFVALLQDVTGDVEKVRSLQAETRRLAEAAARDSLTALYNRRHFVELLEREAARARRYGNALSVVMVDLDRFKRVNDEGGHVRGDQVLESVAEALPLGVREGDVVARWGGDEFAVLLPNTDAVSARAVADRLCEHMRSRRYGPSPGARLTLSLGVATAVPAGAGPLPTAVDLVRRADAALLEAKRAGGDRVSVWGEGAGC